MDNAITIDIGTISMAITIDDTYYEDDLFIDEGQHEKNKETGLHQPLRNAY